LMSNHLTTSTIGSPEPCDGATGCDIIISEVSDRIARLRSPDCPEAITLRLAPYLIGNSSIKVWYDSALLNVRNFLHRDETFELEVEATATAIELKAKLRVLEWNRPRKPSLFF